MTELVAVGWLTTDDIVLTDGTSRMAVPGGGALYSAVGARIWSTSVGLHAAAGRPYLDATLARLAARGIDAAGVTPARGNGIELWLLHEDEVTKQQVAKRSSQLPLELDDDRGSLPQAYAGARAYHIAPQGPRSGISHAERLGGRGSIVTMDILCDRIIDASLYRDLAFTAHLDAFLPSELEIRDVWSAKDPVAWIADTARTARCHVVGKFGSRGSVVAEAEGERLIHVPAVAAEVVDTTGAGDAFCGGFLAGLAAGQDLALAAAMGTVSAAYVIEAVGALATEEPAQAARDRRLAEALAAITTERRP
jgi:ribokinase